MKKIVIIILCIISCNLINGQKLVITDASTGRKLQSSDSVTLTRTIGYFNIYKYENVNDGSSSQTVTERKKFPDQPNCILETYPYLGPDYTYEFKDGDPELEQKGPTGLYEYHFTKKTTILINAKGYEKGIITGNQTNYKAEYGKTFAHVNLKPLK